MNAMYVRAGIGIGPRNTSIKESTSYKWKGWK
jgi:hypothetical protein